MDIEKIIQELQKLPKNLNVYTYSNYLGTDVISIGIKIRKTIFHFWSGDKEELALFIEPLVPYENIERQKININDPYVIEPFPRKVGDEWM